VQIFLARSNQLKYFVALLEYFEDFHSNDRIKNLHFLQDLRYKKAGCIIP